MTVRDLVDCPSLSVSAAASSVDVRNPSCAGHGEVWRACPPVNDGVMVAPHRIQIDCFVPVNVAVAGPVDLGEEQFVERARVF